MPGAQHPSFKQVPEIRCIEVTEDGRSWHATMIPAAPPGTITSAPAMVRSAHSTEIVT
jgi:hypothetical protein